MFLFSSMISSDDFVAYLLYKNVYRENIKRTDCKIHNELKFNYKYHIVLTEVTCISSDRRHVQSKLQALNNIAVDVCVLHFYDLNKMVYTSW